MRVNYQNNEMLHERVKVTFIGYVPSTNKRKRAVLELDAGDLVQLIATAKSFEDFQRRQANVHLERANRIRAELQK